MHELAHEFTNRKVSPWGGMKFFQQTYERSGLKKDLEDAELPEGDSNRAYSAVDLIEGFMVSAVLGSRRMAHTGMLRHDEVIREMFGWKKGMASQSTFSRFFRRFDSPYIDELFTELMQKWWSKIDIKKLTIDLDSTVVTRYGQQEGSVKGYNPQKKGRPSHHPLLAFCDELKMVVNGWMRPGNTSDASSIDAFLDQVLMIIPSERIGLLRADSGFYSNYFMHDLEEATVPYIIRAKMTTALMSKILDIKQWYHNDSVFKDSCYAEIEYKGTNWLKARRAVVVAQPKEMKSVANGVLFKQDRMRLDYDFAVYITSTNLPASKVHALYNQRADCENRIKELKYDYGIDGFALKNINATEAAFRFILLAYNVMALFKQKVMQSPVRHQLSTIRFQCIALGSYLVKNGRNKIMKLSVEGRRRHFLEHFFENLEELTPPFQFSNA